MRAFIAMMQKILDGIFLPLILGLLVSVMVYGLVSYRTDLDIEDLQQKVKVVEQETERLRRNNNRLYRQIMALRDSDAMVEQVAREEGSMIRPGEVVVVFQD